MAVRIDNLYPDSIVILGIGAPNTDDYREQFATFLTIRDREKGKDRVAEFAWEDQDGHYKYGVYRHNNGWALGPEQKKVVLVALVSDPRFPPFIGHQLEEDSYTEWGVQRGGEAYGSDWTRDEDEARALVKYLRSQGRASRVVFRIVDVSPVYAD